LPLSSRHAALRARGGMRRSIPCSQRCACYNEYNFVAAFTMSSLLALLALVTLLLKALVERKAHLELERAAAAIGSTEQEAPG
jgi:ABC-type sulfate transport system permease subunit